MDYVMDQKVKLQNGIECNAYWAASMYLDGTSLICNRAIIAERVVDKQVDRRAECSSVCANGDLVGSWASWHWALHFIHSKEGTCLFCQHFIRCKSPWWISLWGKKTQQISKVFGFSYFKCYTILGSILD